jgi:hypothetical protein
MGCMDPNPARVFRAGPDSTDVEDYPERRLAEAVGRWDASPDASPSAVIRAACDALVAGLDSSALRELAGLPADSRRDEVDAVIATMLNELGIARAHDLKEGQQLGPGGKVMMRPATDHLRLSIARASEDVGGFEVQVFVNDVEMTAAGAGMGMDPYDVLIPENRFIATETSHRVPVARCECGTYGCGVTDVSILRDQDVVHWDWHEEVPMNRGVTFQASEYDAEVVRVAADLSWETPDRMAGRLVLEGTDRDVLTRQQLEFGWVANDYRDPSLFCVCLTYAKSHQIFLYTPWDGRSPQDLANDVVRTLSKRPKSWSAEWLSMKPGGSKPAIAGRRWRPRPIP